MFRNSKHHESANAYSSMPPPAAPATLNGKPCDRCTNAKKPCSGTECPCERCAALGLHAEDCVAQGVIAAPDPAESWVDIELFPGFADTEPTTPATAPAPVSLEGKICERCFKRKKGCSRDERPCDGCKAQRYTAEDCVARGGQTAPFKEGGNDQATSSTTTDSRKGGQRKKQPAAKKPNTGKSKGEGGPPNDVEEGEATARAEAEAEAGNQAVAAVLGRDVQGGNVARLPVYEARTGISAVAGRGIHVPVKVRRGGNNSGDESDDE